MSICYLAPAWLNSAFVFRLGRIAAVIVPVLSLAPAHSMAEASFAAARDRAGRWWFGAAWDAKTKAEADDLAMQRCGIAGPNCQVIGNVTFGCMAFATSSNGAAGIHNGRTKHDAESRALGKCAQFGGVGCVLRHSMCDTVSEQLLNGESERLAIEAKVRRANQNPNGAACKLSGHVLVGSYRYCKMTEVCRPTKMFLEIVGDKILDHGATGGSGIIHHLGQTVDVSADMASLLESYKKLGAYPGPRRPSYTRTYATAAFNGSELRLLVTQKIFSKGDSLFPDNTLTAVVRDERRIDIGACSRCRLRVHTVTFHGMVGVPTTDDLTFSDEKCEVESMK